MAERPETDELGDPWAPIPRFPTGIPGLDRILGGGLLRGGCYLLEGPSGTGKTLLANQVVFHHAAAEGKVVYFSLLSESHARLLQHLQPMEFFAPRLVGTAIRYLSGYQALEQGPRHLLDVIRQSLHASGATLLVIDGLLAIAERTDTPAMRAFLHELQVHTELLGCTTLLVSPSELGTFRPEHALVDGILDLCSSLHGRRSLRELSVRKLRGSGHLAGFHTFEITGRGIRAFPRTEALLSPSSDPPEGVVRRLETGVPELDTMLQGGVWNGSTTMLLGAAGSGKTLLGLHFLAAGAARGEPCLHFGFHESPATLVTKAERVGLPFGDLVARGALRISWQLPVEKLLDRLAEELLAAVEEHGATRLFLDGLNSFRHMTAVPQRPVGFFTALTAELRSRGVTTFLTVESASLFGTEINQPFEGISALVENILLLRYVEYRSSVRRMAGILKLRDSDYDHGLRELLITPQGMRLGGAFVGIESILSGIGRTVS